MPKENIDLLVFNRGLISKLGLARKDIQGKIPFAAEVMTNWMPRSLGPMSLRGGLKYTGATKDNAASVHIPFIYDNDDTAIIEVSNLAIRVKIDEEVVTRGSVSSVIANGTFDTNLTSWTDADESGATSAWATGGYMSLIGTKYNAAIRRQQVTVAVGDQNDEHALNIVIERGPVSLKVGSSAGGDQYISETSLGEGYHSLAFTPTGDFHIEFSNRRQDASLVDSVAIASAGAMVLTAPWVAADLGDIRAGDGTQSADVIFIACDGYQQRRIERRSLRSWSVVLYEPEDGPFRAPNITTRRITPSALTGDITLTASRALFDSEHVGALFQITSTGQNVAASLTAEDQFTDPIRVTGATAAQRTFTFTISDTWTATVTLQRSVGDDSSWVDVTTYTGNTTVNYNDALDNQIIYYRLGIKTGDFTSGTAVFAISYLKAGGITGVVRITAFSSSTSVSARVIVPLGATTSSEDWSEGAWSDYRGWPSAVSFVSGRLSWSGKGGSWTSVSDAFDSFDDEFEGDAGPINKSLGSGPVDKVSWMLELERLVIGTQGAEKTLRSSSFDEPVTPTNSEIKGTGTQGSAGVPAVKIDKRGIFLQKCKTKIFEISYNSGQNSSAFDYGTVDLMGFVPSIGQPRIVKIAAQRQPDTRIHCVRSDGKVAININDPLENVLCWVIFKTDGFVEDVIVMPGDIEDKVYYLVRRTINSSTVRYLEKFALESECNGGTFIYDSTSATVIDLSSEDDTQPYLDGRYVTVRDSAGAKIGNYEVSDGSITLGAAVTYAKITPTLYHLMDSYAVYNGVATTTPTGWSHLEGETVIVWADGKYVGEKTVASGGFTLDTAAQQVVAGLDYEARYKSNKLAYAAGLGTAHNQRKRVNYLGFILADTHASGIMYGSAFGTDTMDDMPQMEDGAVVDPDHIWPDYDKDMTEFAGGWSTDSRVCLTARAGKPCTVLALAIGMVTNDKGITNDKG